MSAARRSGRAYPVLPDVSNLQWSRPHLRDAQPPTPTGPCNFRDLNAGHVCGCRRFWTTTRSSAGRAHIEDNGQDDASCICGHHGCFHELRSEYDNKLSRQHTPHYNPATPSIETLETFEANGTSQRGHEESLLSRHTPGGSRTSRGRSEHAWLGDIDIDTRNTGSSSSRSHPQQHARKETRSNRSSATEIASTPTRTAWLASRTITKSTLDLVKSGLRTLDIGESDAQDQWSKGTSISPAEAGSKRNSTPSAQPLPTEQLHEQLNALKAIVLSVPDVQHALLGIYHRLDAIESMSSSQEVPEDLAERLELLEHLEVRTLELEAKLDNLDNARSFYDDHSIPDTSRKISARNSEEQGDVLLDRLDDVEHRLMRIEGHTLPTSQSPWSVEVVVLPWGTELNGLWFPDSTESAWAQMIGDTSRHSGERLRPRACGPSHGDAGLVYSRLLSCGLVRVVQFIDSSAHHIQSQVLSAYSDVLLTLSKLDQDRSVFQAQLSDKFLGLKSALIPLRKIHRQSTLHYLSPAEMVTPVLWTAGFLESSVFMKAPTAGIRRLYMTTPNGYVQPSSTIAHCTWRTLRDLSAAIRGTSQLNANMSHRDRELDCWAWNHRLDSSPAGSETVQHSASDPHDKESSFPFPLNVVNVQKHGLKSLSRPKSSGPGPLLEVKNEPISDEDITDMPITPTSIFRSSQSHSRYYRKQSDTHRRSESPMNTPPILSRSAPASQKRALTSSFDSYASVESNRSNISNQAGPSSQSNHIKRQRAKKRTRHTHQPSSPVLAEAEPEQSRSSDPKETHAAFAYATPYSWNPARDSPKGQKGSRPEFDSGDTDPLTSSSSAGSDTLDDEDEDNDVDDNGGWASDGSVHGTGLAQLANRSVPYDVDSERARRPARLLSPLAPNPGTPISRMAGGHHAEQAEIQEAASQADISSLSPLQDEHGPASEDESMDEDDIVDEDDAIMEDEADNDNDDDSDDNDNDNDDNDEMVWR